VKSCHFLAEIFRLSINIGSLRNIFFEELRRKEKERISNIEQGISNVEGWCAEGALKNLARSAAFLQNSTFLVRCSIFLFGCGLSAPGSRPLKKSPLAFTVTGN
jgi:hypothetical protein